MTAVNPCFYCTTKPPNYVRTMENEVRELTAQIDRMTTMGQTRDALLTGMGKEIADLKIEKAGLMANLNAANQQLAAAVQWVTYAETMETLPRLGRYILLVRLADRVAFQPGDRWAYIPEPPAEVKE
jgi:small-conductance mechanosensitive channel